MGSIEGKTNGPIEVIHRSETNGSIDGIHRRQKDGSIDGFIEGTTNGSIDGIHHRLNKQTHCINGVNQRQKDGSIKNGFIEAKRMGPLMGSIDGPPLFHGSISGTISTCWSKKIGWIGMDPIDGSIVRIHPIDASSMGQSFELLMYP